MRDGGSEVSACLSSVGLAFERYGTGDRLPGIVLSNRTGYVLTHRYPRRCSVSLAIDDIVLTSVLYHLWSRVERPTRVGFGYVKLMRVELAEITS